MFRFPVLFLIFALIAVMMTGCTNGNSNDVASISKAIESDMGKKVVIKFAWWGQKERYDGTVAAIEKWNNSNPGIQVEPCFYVWDGYNDRLIIEFAENTAPDVFQCDYAPFSGYVEMGVLSDLTPYMDSYFSGIDRNLKSSFKKGDKIFGIASGINGQVLGYNKTKLLKYGIPLPTDNESWDTLLEKCKLATRDTNGDGKIDFWGCFNPISWPLEILRYYLKENGVDLFKKDMSESNITDPKTVKAMKRLEIFGESGVCPEPEFTAMKQYESLMSCGYVAFFPYVFSSFMDEENNIFQITKNGVNTDELDIAAFPSDLHDSSNRCIAAGLPMGIYSGTRHETEAVKFLSWFLTSPDAALEMGMVRGVFPSKAQRETIGRKLNENKGTQKVLRVFDLLTASGVDEEFIKWPKEGNKWLDIYNDERQKYEYKKTTLEEFLQNVKKNADPVLAK